MILESLNKILLQESVSINSVNDAIDAHTRIIINYHTKGEDIATGARIIEVYAYGLTKAGNPVIRAVNCVILIVAADLLYTIIKNDKVMNQI